MDKKYILRMREAQRIKNVTRDILIEEIKKLFNDFELTKEIKEVNKTNEDTINKIFKDIREYAKENLMLDKFNELVRNLNVILKNEDIEVFFDNYNGIITRETERKIVKAGFVPVDKKIKCDRCSLKCTDNNIDINKELTYIKLKYLVKEKVHFQIAAYCSGGHRLMAVKQNNNIDKRFNHTLQVWADYVKRENNKCVKCGSKENLNAHHLIPVGINKRYQYDTRNGITLCEECHKILHRMWKNKEPVEDIYKLSNLNFTTEGIEELRNKRMLKFNKVTLEDIIEVLKRWDEVVNKLPPSMTMYVKDGIPTIGEDGVLTLVYSDDFPYGAMCTERHQAELRNAIIAIVDKDVTVKMKYIDKSDTQSNNIMDITKFINDETTFID